MQHYLSPHLAGEAEHEVACQVLASPGDGAEATHRTAHSPTMRKKACMLCMHGPSCQQHACAASEGTSPHDMPMLLDLVFLLELDSIPCLCRQGGNPARAQR